MIDALKRWARGLKRELMALYLANRDARTPWYARAWSLLVLAYAFSPIDLIPDFIPVLGLLDDALLLPLGILVAVRLIPEEVMREARARAERLDQGERPVSRAGAALIVALWVLALVFAGRLLLSLWRR